MSRPNSSEAPLHIQIAEEILRICQHEHFQAGERVGEQTFAKRLGVSRTPVRKALGVLADQGILTREHGVGFLIGEGIESARLASDESSGSNERSLVQEIMADRASSKLAQDISENELLARYGASRGSVRKALQLLAAENLVFRQRGHGWRFVDSLDTDKAIEESYAFRIEMECGALRQKGYAVDQVQLESMRKAHEKALQKPAGDITREEWFWINASFHEALGQWSNNRFFLQAIRQQNSLRRMHQYADFPGLTHDQIRQSCLEHLGIMDALAAGDVRLAERRLHDHLSAAAQD